ncbi:MAG TPA: L-threonylcarbamoyladenylate synthase [Candidatus Paceibacterota bacterium]|nr:L-threonylcarbamoyladenylate synthase [Candidatus Paceibacterota bacterium]
MKIFNKFTSGSAEIIRKNGIGVMPTDTIYGIVCSALSKKAVNEVYRLRKRSPNKPVIVLISSLNDLKKFDISLSAIGHRLLAKLWAGPISVVLPIASGKSQMTKLKYLHRGKKAIAFRMPASAPLRRFLKKTGPLIAPSANLEGKTPARTIKEAQKYFGDSIDFYIDGGIIKSKPSTLVSMKNGKIFLIRKGAVGKLITDDL